MGQIITKELPLCTLQYVCDGGYNYGYHIDALVDGSIAYDGSNDLFDEDLGFAKKRLHITPKRPIICSVYLMRSGSSDGSGNSSRGELVVRDNNDAILYRTMDKDKWIKLPIVMSPGIVYKITSPLRYLSICEIEFEQVPFKVLITEPLGKIYTVENENLVLLGNDISKIEESRFCFLGDLDFTKITSILDTFNIIKI